MYINLASIQVTISSIDTHTTQHSVTQTHTDIRFGDTKLGAKAFGGGVGPIRCATRAPFTRVQTRAFKIPLVRGLAEAAQADPERRSPSPPFPFIIPPDGLLAHAHTEVI